MKRTITSAACLLALTSGLSQADYFTTNQNSAVQYTVSNNGTFFMNPADNAPGYIVPKDSLTGAIYFMGLQALGLDVNGQLRGAIGSYTESDFFPGPIADHYNDPVYQNGYEFSIWRMSKAIVDYHIAHWQDAGYVPHALILEWPGNGNPSNGEAHQLAPYFDADHDLFYNPLMGDYPLIRGDKALFAIVNDEAGIHPSGSSPIRLEAHLLFYQYDAANDPVLNNTTFINVTLINRGSMTLQDFHFGALVDFDLGNYNDDYLGTMPDRNLAYVYNGDLLDETAAGRTGYGANPPAVGVMTLGKPLHSHAFQTFSTPIPSTPTGYYNLLQGYDQDGNIVTDNNGQPTRYCYTATGAAGWNEYTANNPAGDRRSNISFPAETFAPGAVLCYDYAVVYARSNEAGLFNSADSLAGTADYITDFFSDQDFACLQAVLGTDEQQLPVYNVFPNPVTDLLTISGAGSGNFRIVTPDGKTVREGNNSNGATIDVSTLDKGYYLLMITDGRSEQTISFLKQ